MHKLRALEVSVVNPEVSVLVFLKYRMSWFQFESIEKPNLYGKKLCICPNDAVGGYSKMRVVP
jgi:hypothetical protein